MRLLLDTHALIWAVESPGRLSRLAVAALEEDSNQLLISAGSLWELAIKVGLGKLSLNSPCRRWMPQAISELDAHLLPITIEHADALANLGRHHRDPFDRLLIAQAIAERVPIVSSDTMLDSYGVARIW